MSPRRAWSRLPLFLLETLAAFLAVLALQHALNRAPDVTLIGGLSICLWSALLVASFAHAVSVQQKWQRRLKHAPPPAQFSQSARRRS
jgi:hypothetical protein